ncbi:hypothetical protein [Novosphingobium sp. PC22D]|uniref:DUF6931 family protein n=1 Tax=Novosphingobium sp. PC22D TaxID=1962403 RepID=UPI001145DCAF|nr:hypothetical protein [Novosphingobium sp. PC22D]
MSRWTTVQWTESRQILDLLEWDALEAGLASGSVEDGFAQLRERGSSNEAVFYLAAALPRFEAVRWGCRFLDELSRTDRLSAPDQQALDSVQRWIGEPVEEFRRAALAASQRASEDSPERLIALAAFFSGGNVSAPDLHPVEPPHHAAGRFAGAAILGGVYRNGPDPVRLQRALQLGEEHAL